MTWAFLLNSAALTPHLLSFHTRGSGMQQIAASCGFQGTFSQQAIRNLTFIDSVVYAWRPLHQYNVFAYDQIANLEMVCPNPTRQYHPDSDKATSIRYFL